jgi:hypothetical protein
VFSIYLSNEEIYFKIALFLMNQSSPLAVIVPVERKISPHATPVILQTSFESDDK